MATYPARDKSFVQDVGETRRQLERMRRIDERYLTLRRRQLDREDAAMDRLEGDGRLWAEAQQLEMWSAEELVINDQRRMLNHREP